jgi:hypothetical protein
MSDTALAPSPPPAPVRTRPRWRTLWVIAPVLFVIVLGISRIVYWRTSIAYRPLQLAGLAAPAVGQPDAVQVRPDGLVLTGATGTDQLLEFPVVNDGIHPVEINRVTVEDPSVVGVQWAANFIENGHRVPSPTHALPVRVPGHAIVNLQLVVRKPACSAGERRYLSAVVTIHWHAMISPHATKLDLLAGNTRYVTICSGR